MWRFGGQGVRLLDLIIQSSLSNRDVSKTTHWYHHHEAQHELRLWLSAVFVLALPILKIVKTYFFFSQFASDGTNMREKKKSQGDGPEKLASHWGTESGCTCFTKPTRIVLASYSRESIPRVETYLSAPESLPPFNNCTKHHERRLKLNFTPAPPSV